MEDGRSVLETGRAERSVWLMKCPPLVSRSWKSAAASADPSNPNPAVGKVVLSLDPLRPDDPSSLQAISLSPHSPPSHDAIDLKLEAFEARMKDRLCALFKEFRLGRSESLKRSKREERSNHKENQSEKGD
ncbi:hypothetical protein BHE74_00017023 [Ensete ventricosum]|nr:hypothetical protein BHE74_00017023 [Ensete ventricosum]